MDTLSSLPVEGTSIGHYMIEQKLGRGGMGVVFRARDTKLQRSVALKFLSRETLGSKDAQVRFINEARAASALDHPNICTIYDASTTANGVPYIAMAFYDGESVADLIKSKALSVAEVVEYASQCASGLAKAHKASIVHRDIKPANLFVTRDSTLKILDFGIAKLPNVEMTKTNQTVGTISYMAPEQLRGQLAKPTSDVWALGATMFEMLSGVTPFVGPYDASILYSIVNEPPGDLRKLNPNVSEELANIVYHCLEKRPEDRYESASELLEDLRTVASNERSTSGTAANSGQFSPIKAGPPTTNVVAPNLQDSPAEGTGLSTIVPRGQGVKAAVVGVAAVIGIVALTLFLQKQTTTPIDIGSNDGVTSVAVLPFTATANVDSAEVSGLLLTVTNKLAQIGLLGSQLAVVPASDVQAENIQSPRQASRKLRVSQVVQGDVQSVDGGTKITLQLVDAARSQIIGVRERTVADSRYADVPGTIIDMLTDLFEVDLSSDDRRELIRGDSRNSEANKFYVQALGYANRLKTDQDIETAIDLYKLAIKHDTSYALAYAGLSRAYIVRYRNASQDPTDIDLAAAAAEKAATLDDDPAEVRFALGRLYYQKSDYVSAEHEFLRAVFRDKNLAEGFHWLGHAYFRLGKMDLAEESYDDAIKLEPVNWLFHLSLGMLFDNTGKHLEAIEPFMTATKLAPNVHWGYYNLGVTYYELGDLSTAREWYEKARNASEEPTSEADYYEAHADMKIAEDNFSGSVADWQLVVSKTPQEFHPWHQLGDALYWTGDEAGARRAWLRSDSLARIRLSVSPNDNKALAAVAKTATSLENPTVATEHVARLLALPHLLYEDYVRITMIFEGLGDREKAMSYAGKAFASGATLFNFEVTPWLDDLRSTAEFEALAAENR